jgi:hypothetical protein
LVSSLDRDLIGSAMANLVSVRVTTESGTKED